MPIRLDREFQGLIPPLSDEELAQLEANLLADGCRDPLVVWQEEGILLDGHHRREICRAHGLELSVATVSLPDREAAELWIEENQLGRRNLTDDQRAAIAYRIQQRRSKIARRRRARKGRSAGGKCTPRQRNNRLSDTVADKRKAPKCDSRAAAARQAHVSERKLRRVAELAKGDPKLVGRIVAGEVTIQKARKELHRQVKAQCKAAVPGNLPAITDRFAVYEGRFSEVGWQVKDQSVEWIITDPPYERREVHIFRGLALFAARVLKPGGSLICMVGQSYLPEVFRLLAEHLNYQWTMAYLTPGGQSAQLWGRKVNTFWKPLLWFVKGRYEGDWIGDVCRSEPNDNDKQHHRWGQSESGMADIIERFTYPGQTICDPFCGGGTTGVVAVRMNRLFIGIDSDLEAIETTKRRLAEVCKDV